MSGAAHWYTMAVEPTAGRCNLLFWSRKKVMVREIDASDLHASQEVIVFHATMNKRH